MAELKRPNPGEFYRHFKGNLYQIITVAKHSETKEELVVYQALYDTYETYARPLSLFMGEVEHQKYPLATQTYRFERVTLLEESVPGKAADTKEEPVPGKAADTKEEPVHIPELLLAFLEADTYNEKLSLMHIMKKSLDDKLINDMAASLDIEVAEGTREERIRSLENCLQTLAKYECSRLRIF